jgi:hypothetical protein
MAEWENDESIVWKATV